ncbi:MAG TPA: RHS repeat-associated core domain-containing protein [Solirubrobacteraceae bacterium]|jgi:RHS repeat-associated protein
MKAGARLFLVTLCGLTAMIGWSCVPALAAEGSLQAGVGAEALTAPTAAEPSGAEAVVTAPHGPEIPALRSAYSRTYEGRNGTAQLVLYSQPVNYRDAHGAWQPVDDNLVPSGSVYVNHADRYRAELPSSLADDEAGAVSMAQGSEGVRFQLQGAASSAAAVSGANASYDEALPSTNVNLTAAYSGLQDVLVLKGDGAPSSFTYRLTTVGGLRPVLRPSGDIDLVDPDGSVHLRIPAPVAGDASGVHGPAAFGLTGEGNHWMLTINLDRAWLADPTRAYPVTVDPTTTTILESQLCTLVAASPNTSFCGSSPLEAETVSGQDTKRSLFEFSASALASIPRDSEVIEAKFADNTEAHNKGEGATAYNVKTAWNTTATWNKPVAGGPEWPGGNPYDTGGSSAAATVTNGQLTSNVTGLVRDWIGNKYGGFYGLGLSQVAGGHPLLLNRSPSLTITYLTITGERHQFLYDHQSLDDKMNMAINVGTGDMRLVNEDFALPGPGISIDENRIYESRRMSTPVDLSLGWKFSLGRETGLSSSGVWDAPDGSVTAVTKLGLPESALAANGMTGTSAGDGVDAVYVQNAHLPFNGIMYDATGILFSEKSPLEYVNRDGRSVRLSEGATACPSHGPTLSLTDWVGTTALTLTTNCVGQGQVAQMEDATGRKWKYGYDAQNRLHTYTDPEGGITTYEYNANNLLEKIVTPDGNVTLIGYDPGSLGRVTSITRQDNKGNTLAKTSYSYSTSGQSGPCQPNEFDTTETDPVGRVWQYCFDSRHRMTHYVDPNGHEREATTYGVFGQVHTTAGAAGEKEASPYVDTLDSKTGTTTAASTPSGAQTATEYDADSPYEPQKTTDAQGNKMEMIHDSNTGHMLTAKALKGTTAQSEQLSLKWENGLLQSSALGLSPNQQTTTYKYDSRGNRTEVAPPAPMKPTKMTYDSLDRLSTSTDGAGNETTYHYDNLDRIKEINYSDGSSITYHYDGDGNLKEEVSPTGTALYTYDGMNRRTSTTYGSQTVSETYYPDSHLKELTDAGGTVIYSYNKDGQPASISDPATRKLTDPATKEPAVVQLHWDTDQVGGFPHGLLTEVDEPIGTATEKTGNLQTLYTHDANDRVKTIKSTAGGTTLQSWSYGYIDAPDANLQTDLRQFVEGPAGQQTTYTYDYMNRLVQAITTNSAKTQLYKYTYCYNICTGHSSTEEGFSNILQKAAQVGAESPVTTNYQYNADNEQTSTGDTYDNAGNMTASPSYAMKFNVRDQLTQLTLSGAEPLALGQQGSTNSLLSTVGSTRLENGPLGVAATTNLEGGNGAYYTRTPEGQLINSRTAAGTSAHYYLQDDRGSVVRTTSQAGTPDQEPITYDPFGAPQGSPPAKPPTFGYDGGYQNFTSGTKTSDLIHFGERYYEPSTGSWTQPDPMAGASSLFQANPYQYAGDDPINDSDPTGKKGGPGAFCGHNSREHHHCKSHKNYTKAEIEQFEHEECQTIGVGIAVAGYFFPEAKLAKAILAGIGVGTALSC